MTCPSHPTVKYEAGFKCGPGCIASELAVFALLTTYNDPSETQTPHHLIRVHSISLHEPSRHH